MREGPCALLPNARVLLSPAKPHAARSRSCTIARSSLRALGHRAAACSTIRSYVTGFTAFELPMLGKSVEILEQIALAIVRVALIYNPDNPNSAVEYRWAEGQYDRLPGLRPI